MKECLLIVSAEWALQVHKMIPRELLLISTGTFNINYNVSFSPLGKDSKVLETYTEQNLHSFIHSFIHSSSFSIHQMSVED